MNDKIPDWEDAFLDELIKFNSIGHGLSIHDLREAHDLIVDSVARAFGVPAMFLGQGLAFRDPTAESFARVASPLELVNSVDEIKSCLLVDSNN